MLKQQADDALYRKLAIAADPIIKRVFQEGDIIFRPQQGNRQEPHRVVGFRKPGIEVFNIQRGKYIEDAVFVRHFCVWLPDLDGMMDILLTRYESPESVQETYLKWLKTNKAYRRILVGMYAEMLAFMMDRIYKKVWSVKSDKWINRKGKTVPKNVVERIKKVFKK